MYATRQAMIDRFGEGEIIALTDRPPYAGVINDGILNAAIVIASAEIDSYLGSRYSVPLSPAPAVLTAFACDLVRYHLTGSGATLTTDIEARYTKATRFLERCADGKVTLGGMPDNAGPAPTADNLVQFQTGTRVFSREGF